MKHLTPTIILALTSATPAQEKITYDDHVRTIFEDKCFSCHNPDKAKGGLDLTSYGNTMAGGSSGQIALSGDPGNSKLYNVLTHAEEPVMPPKGDKLAADKLEIVAKWLTGGLLETSNSTAKKAQKPAFAMTLEAPAGKPEGPPPMPGELPLEPEVVTPRATVVADVATSPWAPVIAVTGQKQVLLHHADNLDLLGVLPYPEGFPMTLTFSRNGKLVVAGGGRHGKSGNVVAWDIATGERVLEIGKEFDVVLAADINASQTRVALGGPLKKVKLFDSATGKVVKTIDKHTEWVTALAFSPDGSYLATADRNGGILVWEGDTGNEIHTLEGHKFAVTDLSWRPDSQMLVSASDEDGQVVLWEMKEGKKIKNWAAHGSGTLSVQFASDGNIVTAGRDNRAKLWKGDGGQLRDFEPGTDLFTRSSFNHDGTIAYAADWLGNLHAYDAGDGRRRDTIATNPPSIATRIASATGLIEQHQGELESAKKSHAEAGDAKQRLVGEIAALEAMISSTRSRLDASANEIAELSSTQQRLSEEYGTAEQVRNGHQTQRDAAAASLKSTTEKLATAQSTHASLATQLATKHGELESAPDPEKPAIQSQIDDLTKQVAEIESQVNTLGQAVAEASAARDMAKQSLDAASAQIENISQERMRVYEAIRSANSASQNARTAIPDFEQQLAEKRNALAPADTKLGEAAARLKQASDALNAARSELDHWRSAQAFMEKRRADNGQTAAR